MTSTSPTSAQTSDVAMATEPGLAPTTSDGLPTSQIAAPVQGSSEEGATDPASAQDHADLTPESPDAYSIQRPDLPDGLSYDEGLETTVREAAHRFGLTGGQLQGLVDAFAEYQSASLQGQTVSIEQSAQQTMAALKAEWGERYEVNLDLARRAARTYAGDEDTLGALEQALGDVRLVKFFGRLGQQLAEDQLSGNGASDFAVTPQSASSQLRRLDSRIATLLTRDDPASRRERGTLEDERRRLLMDAYGG